MTYQVTESDKKFINILSFIVFFISSILILNTITIYKTEKNETLSLEYSQLQACIGGKFTDKEGFQKEIYYDSISHKKFETECRQSLIWNKVIDFKQINEINVTYLEKTNFFWIKSNVIIFPVRNVIKSNNTAEYLEKLRYEDLDYTN